MAGTAVGNGVELRVGMHVRPAARLGFTVHADEDRVTVDIDEQLGSGLTLFVRSSDLRRLADCFSEAVAELMAAQYATRGACGSV